MTKKEARQQVKEWMKKLDKNYIEKADQSIFEQVKELKEFQEAKTIFCYASMKNEVDTCKTILIDIMNDLVCKICVIDRFLNGFWRMIDTIRSIPFYNLLTLDQHRTNPTERIKNLRIRDHVIFGKFHK